MLKKGIYYVTSNNLRTVTVLMKVATRCRRPDPATPAGLQQQPVLLWCLHPRTSADGEAHFPPLLLSFQFLLFYFRTWCDLMVSASLFLFLFLRSLWKRNTQICPTKLSVSWRWPQSAHIWIKKRFPNLKGQSKLVIQHSKQLCDAVQGCLRMDPAERLTCEQLLQQPYFDSLRHKSESSSREQQERNKRSRFPRRHLPAGVKSSPAEHSPSHVRDEGQTCIVLHFFLIVTTFYDSFHSCSICHSWPAAPSSQRWTTSGTTTCASSTTTCPTFKVTGWVAVLWNSQEDGAAPCYIHIYVFMYKFFNRFQRMEPLESMHCWSTCRRCTLTLFHVQVCEDKERFAALPVAAESTGG